MTDAVGERRSDAALRRSTGSSRRRPEPVLLAVLHRRVASCSSSVTGSPRGTALPVAAHAMGIASEFRAETLAGQARRWTTGELTQALDGLVELDAMVKGVPGSEADRRSDAWPSRYGSAITRRCGDGSGRSRLTPGPARYGRQSADDQACSWTTRSLSMAKTQRPSPRSSSSISSGSM